MRPLREGRDVRASCGAECEDHAGVAQLNRRRSAAAWSSCCGRPARTQPARRAGSLHRARFRVGRRLGGRTFARTLGPARFRWPDSRVQSLERWPERVRVVRRAGSGGVAVAVGLLKEDARAFTCIARSRSPTSAQRTTREAWEPNMRFPPFLGKLEATPTAPSAQSPPPKPVF